MPILPFFLLLSTKHLAHSPYSPDESSIIKSPKADNYFVDGKMKYTDSSRTELVKITLLAVDVVIPNTVLRITDGSSLNDGCCAECCKTLRTVTFAENSVIERIGNFAFQDCILLKSIQLPNSVRYIGSGAFYNCYNMNQFTLSKKDSQIRSLGGQAFYQCVKLTAFNFSEKLEVIEQAAFELTDLREINLPSSFLRFEGSWGFTRNFNCQKVTFSEGCKLRIFTQRTFNDMKYLKSIEIPEFLDSIEQNCFSGCLNIEKIIVHPRNTFFKLDQSGILYQNDGKELKMYPSGKKDLEKYIIPEGTITTILSTAFVDCSFLKSIQIPSTVTKIEAHCFDGTNLISISVSESNPNFVLFEKLLYNKDKTDLMYCPIGDTSIVSIDIPYSVERILDSAFFRCQNLKSVTFPENSKCSKFGESCFHNSGLTSVVIPKMVNMISTYSFNSCYSLKTVSFSKDCILTIIGHMAFCDCHALESLILPDSVTQLVDCSFQGCRSLSYVKISKNIQTTEAKVFYNCLNLKTVEFADLANCAITTFKVGMFNGCISLENVQFPPKLSTIESTCFKNCKSMKEIILPDTVNNIANFAFEGCSNLTTFSVPKNANNIGVSAFNGCSSLVSVFIPSEVKNIANSAFFICENMVEFKVEKDSLNYKQVDGVLYSYDMKTLCAYPAGKKIMKYEINSMCEKILKVAFYGATNLNYVVFPNSVSVIEDSAFLYCDNLKCEGVLMNPLNFEMFDVSGIVERALKPCPPTAQFTLKKTGTGINENLIMYLSMINFLMLM